MTTKKGPRTRIVTVTPAMAEKWLGKNKNNRHLRREKITQYSGAMKNGEWTIGTDAIGFNGSGGLMNGQHRLTAIVETGVSQQMLIADGLPAGAKLHMDIGLKRSLADYLQMERGEANSKSLAAMLGFVCRWQSER